MIQDLHSHTYYSFCGKDRPEAVIEAAIEGGIELLGICDHNYGVGFGNGAAFCAPAETVPLSYSNQTLQKYLDHLTLLKEKYADQITLLRGIEIATHLDTPKVIPPADADFSGFDYCLIENLDHPNSITQGDLFAFAEKTNCQNVGVAHTDLFAFIRSLGEDPYRYLKRMADQNIFWEMNVSYDSIHQYREHPYMLAFFSDREQQAIVRESGVRLSVGFDGHRVGDYLPQRIRDYCSCLGDMGIKLAFEE
ncbi:MAG: PHP domain-containing protein [Oscillospiraceae bacterium]|nr:PHP domain-containing protein [Oscillospiraceae bacterium]